MFVSIMHDKLKWYTTYDITLDERAISSDSSHAHSMILFSNYLSMYSIVREKKWVERNEQKAKLNYVPNFDLWFCLLTF